MTRTMLIAVASLAVSSMLTGCAASQLSGTWLGTEEAPEAHFEFARVTFAGDGTYTAQIRYGDHNRAMSGHWMVNGGELKLDDGERCYKYEIKADDLYVTDSESRQTVMLTRMK